VRAVDAIVKTGRRLSHKKERWLEDARNGQAFVSAQQSPASLSA